MVLKKQEKNGTVKAIYDSSTICASIYDKDSKKLVVIFKNGGQYSYPNVDISDYTLFETAESNGAVFNSKIKTKYKQFTKMDSLDSASLQYILTEITELKPKEVSGDVEKDMVLVMVDLTKEYLSTGKLETTKLSLLEKLMSTYNVKNNPKLDTTSDL